MNAHLLSNLCIICHLFDQSFFPDHIRTQSIYQYVDQSVMPKACAGLNGMKIGGQVLKVFPAVPIASLVLLIFSFLSHNYFVMVIDHNEAS